MSKPSVWTRGANSWRPLFILLVIWMANASPLSADIVEDEVDAVLSKGLRASGWEFADSSLKARIIAKLQSIMLNDKEYDRRDDARLELLNLEDERAIKDTLRLYRLNVYQRRGMASIMMKSAQPALIPMLMQDMTDSAEANNHPLAATSGEIICRILINTKGIDPDVIDPASK